MMGALQQRRSKKSDGDCEQPPLKPRAATPRTSCADAAALAALVFLASAAPVATQFVHRPDGTYPFEVVDVVLRAGILKLGIAFFCLACELRGLSVTERRDRAPMPSSKGLLLTLCVGAGYQALNLIAGYGMRVLNDATLFAVIIQSKVVWTGLLGVYAFGRRLSAARIGSLILVAAGAAVCAAPKPNTDDSKVCTRVTGCLLAGGAALLSAVLTVGCEAVVKRGRASHHWQNLQLYVVGILVTASALSKQPLWGYVSYAMGALVVLEACKGLAISLVLKRTDAVRENACDDALHPWRRGAGAPGRAEHGAHGPAHAAGRLGGGPRHHRVRGSRPARHAVPRRGVRVGPRGRRERGAVAGLVF